MPAKSRIKAPEPQAPMPFTRAEATECARVVRQAYLDNLGIAKERDQAVANVSERFNARINTNLAIMEDYFGRLQRWAKANPAEFGDARSIKLDGVPLGYRKGNHAAALVSRSWTWEKVLTAIQAGPLNDTLVRTKHEVDKEAAIKMRDEPEALAEVGIKIVQGETFYLTLSEDAQAEELTAKV